MDGKNGHQTGHCTMGHFNIERGIGRHHAGNNIYAYFWEPGGNRFELCTQMAVVMTDEPTHSKDYESATTAWGPEAPETFSKGSGLVH